MKKRYYVIITWRINSPTGMYRVSSKVVLCMTSNKNFTNPDVPMTDFAAASDRLNKAIDNRLNGPAAKTELDDATTDMDAKLRTQAIYVTEASKGDKTIIESSGFSVNKGSETIAVIPDTPVLRLLKSSKGIVRMGAKKPRGATSLCWVIFINSDPVELTITNNMIDIPSGVRVLIIPAGKANEVLTGFAIGTKITVQVLAQNAAGKSALSAPDFVLVNK